MRNEASSFAKEVDGNVLHILSDWFVELNNIQVKFVLLMKMLNQGRIPDVFWEGFFKSLPFCFKLGLSFHKIGVVWPLDTHLGWIYFKLCESKEIKTYELCPSCTLWQIPFLPSKGLKTAVMAVPFFDAESLAQQRSDSLSTMLCRSG